MFLQSNPIAAERQIFFRLATSVGGVLPAQTFSGAEIQICKAGGNWANFGGSVAEPTTANGVYRYQFTTGEIDTPGPIAIRINKAGALEVVQVDEVWPAVFGTAATGTLTAAAFTSSKTEANDFWNDALVLFRTGSLAGQVKKIGDFANSGGLITLATGLAFTAAPANGDVFQILNQ
jgi:hypothetical protein